MTQYAKMVMSFRMGKNLYNEEAWLLTAVNVQLSKKLVGKKLASWQNFC